MTSETRKMLYRIQMALRTTAEQDENDILANAASDLAVRMETIGTTFGMSISDLTELDQQLIQHALAETKEKIQLANLAS